MSFRVEGNIFFDAKLVRTMDDDATLIRLTNRVLGYGGSGNIVTEVKVNWISSETSLLSEVTQIDALDGLNYIWCMHDHEVTAMIDGAIRTSFKYNIS